MLLKKKKLISLLLAFAMIFALLIQTTTIAFAEGEDAEAEIEAEIDSDSDLSILPATFSAAVASPVADVTLPAAQPWRSPAFAGDPSGFRPDQVPKSVGLSAASGAIILYNKAVVPMPQEYGVRRAAGPTQEQIDAVAAPGLSLDFIYNAPISLAEISYENAIVIKAVTYLAGEYSDVATFVYYQRVWVLTDVFVDGDGKPNDNLQKVPTAWSSFILDQVVNEMSQNELACMTGGTVTGQNANEMPHPYGAYSTATINSVPSSYGRTDVRITSATIGTDLGISRLCIPTTQMTDGPAGVRNSRNYTTAWVVATALASSWDREVQHNFGSRVGVEAAYLGFDMMLAPAMNIHRSPMGGRNFEYYSEDPYISYVNGLEYTNALLENRVGVSLKHYMGNDQENNRNNLSTTVSERTLREVMGYPFMRIVEESDPYCMMSIYGIVNQVRASDHHWMVDQLPREQWGFQGYVQTDWGNHWDAHSMAARLNQHQSGNNYSAGNNFVNYENGASGTASSAATKAIRLAILRRNSRDILVSKIKMPSFNGYYNDLNADITLARENNWYTDPASPQVESARLNRDLAAKCFILLKNNIVNGEPVLPLTGANKKNLTLIYSSSVPSSNQGNVDYVVQGGGSGAVSWGRQTTGTIRNALISSEFGYNVPNYIMESNTLLNATNVAATAASYAANTDVGIMIISRTSQEGSDPVLTNFNINANEARVLPALYNAFKAAGKPFLVITNMGGNINTTEIRQYSDAFLHMSAGGEMGGWALADVLSGKVNPSGKTVDSWPLTFDDAVPNLAYTFFQDKIDPSLKNYTWASTASYVTSVYVEDVLVGYKFFETAEALDPNFKVDDHLAYPFGFGLSYTTFEYSNIRLDKEHISTANDETVKATVTVKNTGSVTGRTAVELYLSASTWKEEGRSIRDLRNYAMTKVLAPGESQDVSFTIQKRDLCYFDDGKRMADGSTWKPWNLKMSGTAVTATVVPSSDPVFAAYANLQITSTTDQLNTMGYTRTSLNGVEAYTTYNGFYGDGGHKTGWRVDPGTVFTVQIGDSSRTPDLAARGVSASFTYGEVTGISAPEIWNTDTTDTLKYDINVAEVTNSNLIEIVAKFDKQLTYVESEADAGFTILSANFDAATGDYIATLAYLKTGQTFSTADFRKILTVSFKGKLAFETELKGVLVSAKFDKPNSETLNSPAFAPGSVFTIVDNYMRWNINKDSKLDNSDLSDIIYLYYLAMEGDANWSVAKLYDANSDGKVDLLDIMYIFSYCKG